MIMKVRNIPALLLLLVAYSMSSVYFDQDRDDYCNLDYSPDRCLCVFGGSMQ